MKKERLPKFHALRIYLSSSILYYFLVLPFISFLVFQNLPDILGESESSAPPENSITDTIYSAADSNQINKEHSEFGEIVNSKVQDIEPNNEFADSIVAAVMDDLSVEAEEENRTETNQNLKRFFQLYSISLLISFLLGLLFNRPFKLYLKRKRKQRETGKRLGQFCKKFILYTPVINCLILFLPHAVSHIFAISTFFSAESVDKEIEQNIFQNFFYVSLVAAFLTLLFVYFWQKNRVHLKYIEFFYTKEELRKRIFRSERGNIGRQLWLANQITTFLPLAIVALYFVLSLSSVKDLQIENMTQGQNKVLFGRWDDTLDIIAKENTIKEFTGFYYVTAIDTIVMFVGIGTGILVSIFYIFLIVTWTTRSIVNPVNELLYNMKEIRRDGIADFTIVRTNDELGELAEGFNIMIQKIKDYINSISQMNKDLEDKVIERTKEIAEQKEEIEAQKEEIETQLEMVINQKDMIEAQKHQIVDSIYYAKRIQTAILPPEDTLKKTFTDYFVLYNPRDIVSGDFYWNIEKDNKVYIAVADCTGHGVPGAFLSILGISYLNEIINKDNLQNAGEILDRLREALIFSLHQKGEEGETQDGLEVALCILDLDNNTLQYSGANRPFYLVRKVNKKEESSGQLKENVQIVKEGDYRMLIYKPDIMPIGIYNDTNLPFTNNDISLLTGDSIYLFTDGYVDQIGGPNRKTYRVKYFRELLFRIHDKEMREQGNILAENINQWRGDKDQTDDILVIGIKL